MEAARLTAVAVKTKDPGRYSDGNGLILDVSPSGARSWLLRVVVHGKRRDIGLGACKHVTLADARAEAVRMRRIARQGGDPLAERRMARTGIPTFQEAAQTVHGTHAQAFRNAKHRAQWLASLKADVFPVFGAKSVDQVGTADVLKALATIWTTKPETARRIRQRIRVVLDWARASGFRSGENPVDGISRALPRHTTAQTHHAALPYADVPAFVVALREADASPIVRVAFELLILTATRTSEVLGTRWEELDLDAGVWTIPAERIKAGREHRVPLAPRCLELFQTVEKTYADRGPYVFAGRREGKPLSNMVFLMTLRRMKRETITAHGFRSAFRDWAAEKTNFPRDVCEAALAHVVKDRVEAAYKRTDHFEQRRTMMQQWATFATTKPQGKVVAFGS